MDTLFAIGMLVGLMRGHAEPPKVVAAPLEQRGTAQRQAEAEKPQHRTKSEKSEKTEWLLSY
jgi:hypothetical protein